VVALNKKGHSLLGSCKWLARPAGVSVLDDLYAARGVLGPRAARAKLVIFSKSGFNETLQEKADAEGISLIDVRELFA
jgi:hypothetical protein